MYLATNFEINHSIRVYLAAFCVYCSLWVTCAITWGNHVVLTIAVSSGRFSIDSSTHMLYSLPVHLSQVPRPPPPHPFLPRGRHVVPSLFPRSVSLVSTLPPAPAGCLLHRGPPGQVNTSSETGGVRCCVATHQSARATCSLRHSH